MYFYDGISLQMYFYDGINKDKGDQQFASSLALLFEAESNLQVCKHD